MYVYSCVRDLFTLPLLSPIIMVSSFIVADIVWCVYLLGGDLCVCVCVVWLVYVCVGPPLTVTSFLLCPTFFIRRGGDHGR